MADVRAAADKPADKPAEKAPEKATDKPVTRGGLKPVAESSDPTIHQLMAKRQNIADSYDLEEDEAEVKEREERRKQGRSLLAEVDKQIEELGYTAK